MAEITLVRHGQANAGAASEEDYDRLSDLGHQQAAWLGDYFAGLGATYDRIIHGDLHRQRGTAAAIGKALDMPLGEDARLNEMHYFSLAAQLQERHGVPLPVGREGFLAHVPQVLSAWRTGEITSTTENYAAFEARVLGVLEDMIAAGGRTMLVTSGGVIATILRHVLGLDDPAHAKVLLSIYNGSFHRFHLEGDEVVLDTFNAVPHLEGPARDGAKTYL